MLLLTRNSTGEAVLDDVYFGDVWLCGGQDNMEMAISEVFNATQEVSAMQDYPLVRLYTAPHVSSVRVRLAHKYWPYRLHRRVSHTAGRFSGR
jgi:sialate O-acetylesterase